MLRPGTDMVLCVMTYLAADQQADDRLTFGVLVCQERLEHTPKPDKAIQMSLHTPCV
jgi:hypothetical protein